MTEYSNIRTVEAWCCGIAADDELGHTDIKVYATKEACEKANNCTIEDTKWCSPRKLTITFGSNWTAHKTDNAEKLI